MARRVGLPSWRDTPTRAAIERFVADTTTPGGPGYVPPTERVAVFDNDGTLWCEKPTPVELGFIWHRMAAMVAADPTLAGRQPWQAAAAGDLAWLGGAVTKHYEGDDGDVKLLLGAILRAFDGMSVDEYAKAAAEYVDKAEHPVFGRKAAQCVYQPMLELLRYLEAHEFITYIASGGDRDFMRPVVADAYGVPPERVIGSSNALRYGDDGALRYAAEPDVFDDGPVKPVRIWSRIGRRPIVAAGNSNGDVPMLRFTGGGRPALRLLIDHDDAEREVAYTAGAEDALKHAAAHGWTVVSMSDDWAAVFPGPDTPA